MIQMIVVHFYVAIDIQVSVWNIYMRYKNLFDRRKGSYVVAALVAVSLVSYFFVSTYILPDIYVRTPKPKPVPVISKANISSPVIHLGKTFFFDLQAKNVGDDADMQIISIAFPNLTRTDRNVYIRQSDLTQKPLFVNIGDKVGSDYTGLENIVYAKYPSIEAFSRPWHSNVPHSLTLEIRPSSVGKFVIFLKVISLPHTQNLAHYPYEGIKDFQNEYVKVYPVEVLQN
jgi:hypothetical protein